MQNDRLWLLNNRRMQNDWLEQVVVIEVWLVGAEQQEDVDRLVGAELTMGGCRVGSLKCVPAPPPLQFAQGNVSVIFSEGMSLPSP